MLKGQDRKFKVSGDGDLRILECLTDRPPSLLILMGRHEGRKGRVSSCPDAAGAPPGSRLTAVFFVTLE